MSVVYTQQDGTRILGGSAVLDDASGSMHGAGCDHRTGPTPEEKEHQKVRTELATIAVRDGRETPRRKGRRPPRQPVTSLLQARAPRLHHRAPTSAPRARHRAAPTSPGRPISTGLEDAIAPADGENLTARRRSLNSLSDAPAVLLAAVLHKRFDLADMHRDLPSSRPFSGCPHVPGCLSSTCRRLEPTSKFPSRITTYPPALPQLCRLLPSSPAPNEPPESYISVGREGGLRTYPVVVFVVVRSETRLHYCMQPLGPRVGDSSISTPLGCVSDCVLYLEPHPHAVMVSVPAAAQVPHGAPCCRWQTF